MMIWTRASLAAANRVRRALEAKGYRASEPFWAGGREPWVVLVADGWEGEL